LLPRLALDIGHRKPADLAHLFNPPAEIVRLEIGFGGGEHLIAEARAFPDIASSLRALCERQWQKSLTQIEAHNIGNVRLFAGDAAELLAWAPARSLARIDLIHPIMAEAAALEAALRAGCDESMHGSRAHAVWRIFASVSDIDDYCAWTLAIFCARRISPGPRNKPPTGRLPWPTTR